MTGLTIVLLAAAILGTAFFLLTRIGKGKIAPLDKTGSSNSDNRKLLRIILIAIIAFVILFCIWMAFMVFSVGPYMRNM